MDDSLKANLRLPAVFLWTGVLAALLFVLDRWWLGPPVRTGWQAVVALEDVPRAAGKAVVPSYLPANLRWPPARILFRSGDDPGLWISVTSERSDEEVLWIGSGPAATPHMPDELAACALQDHACPPGWERWRVSVAGRDKEVVILSRLDETEIARMIDTLRLAHP